MCWVICSERRWVGGACRDGGGKKMKSRVLTLLVVLLLVLCSCSTSKSINKDTTNTTNTTSSKVSSNDDSSSPTKQEVTKEQVVEPVVEQVDEDEEVYAEDDETNEYTLTTKHNYLRAPLAVKGNTGFSGELIDLIKSDTTLSKITAEPSADNFSVGFELPKNVYVLNVRLFYKTQSNGSWLKQDS